MLLEKLLSNLAIDVQPFAICQISTGWRLSLPGPPEVMFHFVLEGRIVLRGANGFRVPMGPYWLAVVPTGCVHALEWEGSVEHDQQVAAGKPDEGAPAPEGVLRILAGPPQHPDVLVACGLASVRYGPSFGLFDHLREMLAVDLSEFPQIRSAFEGILAEQGGAGPGGQALSAALMTQTLVYLFRKLTVETEPVLPWLAALEDSRLARAIDRVLEDPGADHRVETLAEAASMSRSAFAERFHAAFGRTPMGLVHHVRMQHAARVLESSPALSIDEVAGKVGFASRSHFSQAFKKHCGVSPAEFRAGRSGPAAASP